MDPKKAALQEILALAREAMGEQLKGLKKPAMAISIEKVDSEPDSADPSESAEGEDETCPDCGESMEDCQCEHGSSGKVSDTAKLKALAKKLGK